MIITLELQRKLLNQTEAMYDELEKVKNSLTKKEYKKRKKQIYKYLIKENKRIKKQYPVKKELERFLMEEKLEEDEK